VKFETVYVWVAVEPVAACESVNDRPLLAIAAMRVLAGMSVPVIGMPGFQPKALTLVERLVIAVEVLVFPVAVKVAGSALPETRIGHPVAGSTKTQSPTSILSTPRRGTNNCPLRTKGLLGLFWLTKDRASTASS